MEEKKRQLLKSQMSELKFAARRIGDARFLLEKAEQDVKRRTETVAACIDLPPHDDCEFRSLRETCKPPSRDVLDSLGRDVISLMQQGDVHPMANVSDRVRETIKQLTLQITSETLPEKERVQADFLTLCKTERGAIQGSCDKYTTNDVRRGVKIHAQHVQNLRIYNVLLTTESGGSQCSATGFSRGKNVQDRVHHRVEIEHCDNIDLQQVHVAPCTGASLQDAVESTLLATFNWDVVEQYKEQMEQTRANLDKQERKVQDELKEARQQQEKLKAEVDSLRARLRDTENRVGSINKEQQSHLSRAEEEQRQSEGMVVLLQRTLSEEHSRGQEKLRAMEIEYKALRQKEELRQKESVMMFVLKLEDRDRQLVAQVSDCLNDQPLVREVVQRLVREFNIRLLGVDCGLNFLMEAPEAQWNSVVERKLEMQHVIEELLPKALRRQLRWADEMTPADVDLRMGLFVREERHEPYHARDHSNEAAAINSTDAPEPDPMTATPSPIFLSTPTTGALITAIIHTEDGRLVMADYLNKKVKVVHPMNMDTVSEVSLLYQPWALALLHDGLVAVTSCNSNYLYIVSVCGHQTDGHRSDADAHSSDVHTSRVRSSDVHVHSSDGRPSDCHLSDNSGKMYVVSKVRTVRHYMGIAAGMTDDTLIVSCRKDEDGPATIDVITRAGIVTRTIVNLNKSLYLGWSSPSYLFVSGDDMLVSDFWPNTVFRVKVSTGDVVERIENVNGPRQVCADRSGNIYIASLSTKCVLVLSAAGRRRRELLVCPQDKGSCVMPWGLCIMNSRLFVSWAGKRASVVASYALV